MGQVWKGAFIVNRINQSFDTSSAMRSSPTCV
jgi:hypothetical protein